jgi:hypothetical protein
MNQSQKNGDKIIEKRLSMVPIKEVDVFILNVMPLKSLA